jgi:hypothetical protein
VIELKHAQIGFTAIDARVRAKILRNPAAIARAVARGVYDAPLVMDFLVPAIMSLAVFALTSSAAASEAIAMLGKTFERKYLVTNATFLHVEDRSTLKCHQYCTVESYRKISLNMMRDRRATALKQQRMVADVGREVAHKCVASQ